jgi:hypothetical protein
LIWNLFANLVHGINELVWGDWKWYPWCMQTYDHIMIVIMTCSWSCLVLIMLCSCSCPCCIPDASLK